MSEWVPAEPDSVLVRPPGSASWVQGRFSRSVCVRLGLSSGERPWRLRAGASRAHPPGLRLLSSALVPPVSLAAGPALCPPVVSTSQGPPRAPLSPGAFIKFSIKLGRFCSRSQYFSVHSYSLLLRPHQPHEGCDVQDRPGPQAAYLSPAWFPLPQLAHLCSPVCWSGPPREFFISGIPDPRSGIFVVLASLSLPRLLAFVLMLLLSVRYLTVLSTCFRSSCTCAIWGCLSPTPPSPGRSLHTRALNLLLRRCRPWDLLP